MSQVFWLLGRVHGVVRHFSPFSPWSLVLSRINDADHPLGTGMDMNVSDLNGLLVAAPVPVQCLDQLELQAQQSSGIAPVDADERFVQMPLAVLKELEAGESRGNDLNSDQRLEFTLRLNGGDQRDRCIESCLLKHVIWSRSQRRDELRQHRVDELVGERLPEDGPKSGFCSSSSAVGATTSSLCLVGFLSRGGAFFAVGPLRGREPQRAAWRHRIGRQ